MSYKANMSEEYMPKEERQTLYDALWKYARYKYDNRPDFAERQITVDQLLSEISYTLTDVREEEA